MTIISINCWFFINFPIKQLVKVFLEIGFNAIKLTARDRDILKENYESLESLRKYLDMHSLEVSAINVVVSFAPHIHGTISSKIP